MTRWNELSQRQRLAIRVGAAVQLTLAIAAWLDLAKRPASEIRGSKRGWALAILVNFVGPIAYFWRGRASRASRTN
ncbi:MAG: hypothetical protein GEU98_18720 [Pseudonocardiaceae bacterium]|nr:hypothetical protein [Pseudonocardiaceae bacterium]